MKKASWRKWHKWMGISTSLFLIVFCLSGILLNHRREIAAIDVSRRYLPEVYHHQNWSMGLLRSTLRWGDRVLVYGVSGMWLADTLGQRFEPCNLGLPTGIDGQHMRSVVQMPDSSVFALTQFGLYRHPDHRATASTPHRAWQAVALPEGEHRYASLAQQGDSLLVLGRSHVYLATAPYRHFRPITLRAHRDYDGSVSLFRTVWMLHSGEAFGELGKAIMDIIGLLLIGIALTGLLLTLLPQLIRRAETPRGRRPMVRLMGRDLDLHDLLGRKTIVLTLWVALSGWALRPPLLIALAQLRTPALPYTTLSSSNPWEDRLRLLKFDPRRGDWLLSTSEGFFSLDSLSATPQRIQPEPPVSVMGINVMEQEADGRWLVGSFSGLYLWDRARGKSEDYFTHEPVEHVSKAPFGKMGISGFSRDFRKPNGQPIFAVVEHYKGCAALPQPEHLRYLPISLWNVALEAHNGRIYTFLIAPALFFNFVAGLAIMIALYSGWKVRLRRKARRASKTTNPPKTTRADKAIKSNEARHLSKAEADRTAEAEHTAEAPAPQPLPSPDSTASATAPPEEAPPTPTSLLPSAS